MYFKPFIWDVSILELVNMQWRNPFFDWIMPILSSMWPLLIIALLAIPVILYFQGKKYLICALLILCAMGMADLGTNIVKKQVQRVRPLNALPSIHYKEDGEWKQRSADFVQTKENGTSYPSAHAANTMCLSILGMLFWPRLKKYPLLIPLAVGYSRLYLGKHYPTDILAGFLFGIIISGTIWIAWLLLIKPRFFDKSEKVT